MRFGTPRSVPYNCVDYGGKLEQIGEKRQEDDAYWLTHLLMVNEKVLHVFYYEFLYKNHEPPPCTPTQADTALYVPSSDPNAPDRPRAARRVRKVDSGVGLQRATADQCAGSLPCFASASFGGDAWSGLSFTGSFARRFSCLRCGCAQANTGSSRSLCCVMSSRSRGASWEAATERG
jgi:hypothetical protein